MKLKLPMPEPLYSQYLIGPLKHNNTTATSSSVSDAVSNLSKIGRGQQSAVQEHCILVALRVQLDFTFKLQSKSRLYYNSYFCYECVKAKPAMHGFKIVLMRGIVTSCCCGSGNGYTHFLNFYLQEGNFFYIFPFKQRKYSIKMYVVCSSFCPYFFLSVRK